MKREDFSWDKLDSIQKSQLIKFYPELAEKSDKDKLVKKKAIRY